MTQTEWAQSSTIRLPRTRCAQNLHKNLIITVPIKVINTLHQDKCITVKSSSGLEISCFWFPIINMLKKRDKTFGTQLANKQYCQRVSLYQLSDILTNTRARSDIIWFQSYLRCYILSVIGSYDFVGITSDRSRSQHEKNAVSSGKPASPEFGQWP